MIKEYELISRKCYLRIKRGHLFSMMQDTKSSLDFRNACLKRINFINQEISKIDIELKNYRKVNYYVYNKKEI